ncbi:MAG: hypothetical protein HQ582_25390 [Planctomycetes bacterium]|nr:hypothetical protein [Planctomycetota bacterium]
MMKGLQSKVALGMAWAVVVAISGCQRARDVPLAESARKPLAASESSEQQVPTPAVEGDTPEPATESEQEVPLTEGNAAVGPQTEETQEAASGGEEATEAERAAEDLIQAAQGATEDVMEVEDGAPSETPAKDEEEGQLALPTPLVDDPQNLQPLHPRYPVWINRDRTHVVMVGRVCQRRAPLELFACMKGSKEHESVLTVNTEAYVMHAGLLAVGAEPGSPVKFTPEYAPANGPEIEITLIWDDESGRRRRARAQDWVQDVAGIYQRFQGVIANQFDDELNLTDQFAACKSMQQPWVFAGSQFVEDEQTGKRSYLADVEGELICVSNFPSAVLDVPFRSSGSNASLLFETFTERIPALGTPVTLVLEPQAAKR